MLPFPLRVTHLAEKRAPLGNPGGPRTSPGDVLYAGRVGRTFNSLDESDKAPRDGRLACASSGCIQDDLDRRCRATASLSLPSAWAAGGPVRTESRLKTPQCGLTELAEACCTARAPRV